MKPSARLVTAAAVAALATLAFSLYQGIWGGVALVVVLAAGYAWYRVQVARGEQAQAFFSDPGEDTRLTQLQGSSPSEMPLDRPTAPDQLPRDPRH